ncbi:hypothetical protein K9N68_28685 [Kovacikia minuta CCNUW1]|uniref:hypothetical protein n=1 Tax=Kovacikia minuta TaxID=2931930 RepID=UPI001CCB8E79|nr:hypothetical protein [Kovacikia minuta]UBF25514.1 hypothetical protein K9N68_28685 [Kovacikia minuta CCNUW1]
MSFNSIKCIAEHFEADMDRKSDRKLVSFRLPENLMQDLRERAESDNISVTELVCRLLRQGLQTTVDDRIASLEAEVQELRKLKQVNLGGIAPASIYTMVPHNGFATEGDSETKRRVADLESRMEEVLSSVRHIGALPTYLAKLETLIEEVQTNQAAAYNRSIHSQEETLCEEIDQKKRDRATAQSTIQKPKPSSSSA